MDSNVKLMQLRGVVSGSPFPQICTNNEVAHLTVGMPVEVSGNPDVCVFNSSKPNTDFGIAPLVRVRVTSGKDAGVIGCVNPDALRDPTPF
jgi:hypothetical protein